MKGKNYYLFACSFRTLYHTDQRNILFVIYNYNLFLSPYYQRRQNGTLNVWLHIYKTQTICAFIIYLSTTITIFVLINYHPEFNYNPNVILSNIQFKTIVFNLVFLGLASVILLIDFSSFSNPRKTKETNNFDTLIEEENQVWSAEQNLSTWYELLYSTY